MKRTSRLPLPAALLALWLLAAMPSAQADNPPSPWHGSLTQDALAVLDGGAHGGLGMPGLLHLNLTLDGRRWGGSSDTVLYVDAIGTYGHSISDRAGDLQGLDNAEAPHGLRLFEAWLETDLGSPAWRLRMGLIDYNNLFDTLDAASLFLNSSFGIEPSISQSGASIFPVTTLGTVLGYKSDTGRYVKAGVFDGAPGLPGHPHGTHVRIEPRDGVFAGIEGGIATQGPRPAKLAVGAWADTSHHPPGQGYPERNRGLYVIGETRLLGEGSAPHALDGFVQWGSAQPRDSRIDRYLGIGIRMLGAFMRGQRDQLGLAVARAHVRAAPGMPPGSAETAWELTWSAPLGAFAHMQPDLQYIQRPGADGDRPDAWVAGVRLHLEW